MKQKPHYIVDGTGQVLHKSISKEGAEKWFNKFKPTNRTYQEKRWKVVSKAEYEKEPKPKSESKPSTTALNSLEQIDQAKKHLKTLLSINEIDEYEDLRKAINKAEGVPETSVERTKAVRNLLKTEFEKRYNKKAKFSVKKGSGTVGSWTFITGSKDEYGHFTKEETKFLEDILKGESIQGTNDIGLDYERAENHLRRITREKLKKKITPESKSKKKYFIRADKKSDGYYITERSGFIKSYIPDDFDLQAMLNTRYDPNDLEPRSDEVKIALQNAQKKRNWTDDEIRMAIEKAEKSRMMWIQSRKTVKPEYASQYDGYISKYEKYIAGLESDLKKAPKKVDRSKSVAAGKNLYQEKYNPGKTHLAKTKTLTDMQKRRLIKACIDNEVDTRELDPSLKYDENQEILQDMIQSKDSQFQDDSKSVDKKIAKLENIYYDDFGKERTKEREIDAKTTEEKVISKVDLSRKRKKTQLDQWKKEPYKSKVDVEEIDTAATFQKD